MSPVPVAVEKALTLRKMGLIKPRQLCVALILSSLCLLLSSCANQQAQVHLAKDTDQKLFRELTTAMRDTEFNVEHKWGDIVLDQPVFFLFGGGSNISDDNKHLLKRFAKILKSYPYDEIEISGYTDNIGSLLANDRKSTNWAKKVYDYLRGQGIPSSKMTYYGHGEFRPIASNFTEAGRFENRRVEITIK